MITPNIVNALLIASRDNKAAAAESPKGADSEDKRGPLRKCRLALQPRAGGAARRQLPASAAFLPVPHRGVRRRQVVVAAHAVSCAQADTRADQPVRA